MLMMEIERWFTKSMCLCRVTLRKNLSNWRHNKLLLLLFTAIEFSLGGGSP